MTTDGCEARDGLPGGWALPICLVWLICALTLAWLNAGEVFVGMHGQTKILLLVESGLGGALGVALAKQRRTAWILLAIVPAALLATVVYEIALPDDPAPEFDFPVLNFLFFLVVLGLPLYAGAFLVAIWRRHVAGS